MSELTRRPAAEIVSLDPQRMAMKGTLAQIDAALVETRRHYLVAGTSDPQPTGDGLFLVNVRVLPQPRTPPLPVNNRRRNLLIAGGVSVTIFGVCGFGLWAVQPIVEWVFTHVIAAGVIVVLGVLVAGVVGKALKSDRGTRGGNITINQNVNIHR